MRAIEQQKNGFLKSKGPPTFPSHWLWSSNKSLFFLHHANMKWRAPFMFAYLQFFREYKIVLHVLPKNYLLTHN